MQRFFVLLLIPCLLFACKGEKQNPIEPVFDNRMEPMAVLQAGLYPLWFQIIDYKPVLLDSIDDAVFSSPLIPWPLAPHVRSALAFESEIYLALNRCGFICFVPWEGQKAADNAGVGMYFFSGSDFWRQYTVDTFFLEYDLPVALLYRDDRFYDSNEPVPSPRTWTFDFGFPLTLPFLLDSLEYFPSEEGWDIDGLRLGGDNRWYFRAVKKNPLLSSWPEIVLMGCDDLFRGGEKISQGVFRNASLPEPLIAAPAPLKKMLEAVFAKAGFKTAAVISPEFLTVRHFGGSSASEYENTIVPGFYSELPRPLLLVCSSGGDGFIAGTGGDSAVSVNSFSLPSLPENFVYTGITLCKDTIIASWEEQEGYCIGAAGFMVIKL